MLRYIQSYLQNYAAQKTRQELLKMPERQLADLGISRDLLERGPAFWPWKIAEEGQPERMTSSQIDKAVHELHSMSDSQLRDIGIHRGMIRQAVIHGVDGRGSDPKKAA